MSDNAARDDHRAPRNARERTLGTDHPDTLGARGNLAYGAAGRAGEAIDLQERVVADCERILGTDHPNTLTARSNLAYSYGSAGRGGEAIDLQERVLADRERTLGTDHPDTRAAREVLERWRGEEDEKGVAAMEFLEAAEQAGKINTTAPDGYTLPRGAQRLLDAGKRAGWWPVFTWAADNAGHPFVKVMVAIPDGESITATWHNRDLDPGQMRLFGQIRHTPIPGHVGNRGWSLKRAINHVLRNGPEVDDAA
ncbi:tetratricopeptide repeat protein [Streptomyces sp. SM12]|uniref:tetratricopeptide repeat protein n=1 Tax=Streptomyces sp. SM12 TaxID=1071602 RepID=UPI000CD49EDB|nr:tetratricopeptide repeat protein [Streptomyces sp. SM12]